MKKILVPIILIVALCVSCAGEITTGTDLPILESSSPPITSTPDIATDNITEKLSIFWHLKRDDADIEEWEDLISQESKMDIAINSYAEMQRLSSEGKVLNDNENFIYPEDCSEEVIYYMSQKDGLFLISIDDFLRLYNKRENYFQPVTQLPAVLEIDNRIKAILYDNSGELWCLPREILEPIVWVRYYNQEIMDSHGATIPENLTQLTDLLKEAKNYGYCPIRIEEPFSMPYRLVDIFAAFDIDYNLYPIRYNEDVEGYIDQIASDNMKKCIEFLCSLADEELIEFGKDNENTDDSLFSSVETFKKLGYYSINLFNDIYDLESHEYYEPVSYVYVVPKETEMIEEINRYFRGMYLTDSMYLKLRFGAEDNVHISDNKVYLDDYEKLRPNLVGSLPGKEYYVVYKEKSEDVLNEKYRIIGEEITNGYYKQTPINRYVYTDSTIHMGEILANDFKKMLYDYLSAQERESIDDLIKRYTTKATSAGLLEEIQRMNNIRGTDYRFTYVVE